MKPALLSRGHKRKALHDLALAAGKSILKGKPSCWRTDRIFGRGRLKLAPFLHLTPTRMTNQHHNPLSSKRRPRVASTVLLIGLAVAAAGAFAVFSRRVLSNSTSSSTSSGGALITAVSSDAAGGCAPPAQARTLSPLADVAHWRTYSDPAHSLSFRYPENFGEPQAVAHPGDQLSGPYESVVFNTAGGAPLVCLELTSFEGYVQTDGKANPIKQENLDILKRGYQNAQLASLAGELIPTEGTGYASTDSRYLELPGTPWRGYYRFNQPETGDRIAGQYADIRSSQGSDGFGPSGPSASVLSGGASSSILSGASRSSSSSSGGASWPRDGCLIQWLNWRSCNLGGHFLK